MNNDLQTALIVLAALLLNASAVVATDIPMKTVTALDGRISLEVPRKLMPWPRGTEPPAIPSRIQPTVAYLSMDATLTVILGFTPDMDVHESPQDMLDTVVEVQRRDFPEAEILDTYLVRIDERNVAILDVRQDDQRMLSAVFPLDRRLYGIGVLMSAVREAEWLPWAQTILGSLNAEDKPGWTILVPETDQAVVDSTALATDVLAAARDFMDAILTGDEPRIKAGVGVPPTDHDPFDLDPGRASLSDLLEQMRAQNITLDKGKVSPAVALHRSGQQYVAVLPTFVQAFQSDRVYRRLGYFLGLRMVDGGSWSFLDGDGILRPQALPRLFPGLPEGTPEPEKRVNVTYR